LRSDIGLSAKRDTEIRENPTRRATYNPARGGFYRLVENRPDPDAGVGYPSIPRENTLLFGGEFLIDFITLFY